MSRHLITHPDLDLETLSQRLSVSVGSRQPLTSSVLDLALPHLVGISHLHRWLWVSQYVYDIICQNSQTEKVISIAWQQSTAYPLGTWSMELLKWMWCIPSPHDPYTTGKTFIPLFTCGQFPRVHRTWTTFMLETTSVIRQTWSRKDRTATGEHYRLKAVCSIKSEFKPWLSNRESDQSID